MGKEALAKIPVIRFSICAGYTGEPEILVVAPTG